MSAGTILSVDAVSVPAPEARRWADPMLLGGALFAALMLLADRLLADPDTHWHVAIGSRIWRDGAVPWIDTDTHTFAGAPWIAKEWLSQLLLFGAHSLAGWSGVVVLTAGTLAAVFAVLFAWLERRLRGTLALAMTLAAIVFVAPHFLARPHVFALLTLLAWTIGLVTAAERNRAPSPWLLGVLALWANLHGSFTFAYPLAALIGADAVWSAPARDRLATARRWALFGLLALGAGCLTPYGVHAMGVTATIFGSGESLPFVTEWQPLALDGLGIGALAAAALLVGALAAEPARNLLRILAVAALTAMMLRHSRFLDVFALVAPVLAAGPILRRWPALGPESGGTAGWGLRPAMLGGLLVFSIGLVAARSPEPAPAVTPAAALEAAQRLGARGPVYNDYDFGGFLIARGVPTFIDGRTDQLFLGGFISGLYRAVRSEDPAAFLDLLRRRRVGWALVKPDSAEARHLDGAAGWRRAYGDADAVVFLRG